MTAILGGGHTGDRGIGSIQLIKRDQIMNNQKINNLFKDPRTNWKYIWIIIILGFLAGAGILGYYYLWIAELEAKLTELEFQLPEELIPGIEYFIGGLEKEYYQ